LFWVELTTCYEADGQAGAAATATVLGFGGNQAMKSVAKMAGRYFGEDPERYLRISKIKI
jgi:hypothetical protein